MLWVYLFNEEEHLSPLFFCPPRHSEYLSEKGLITTPISKTLWTVFWDSDTLKAYAAHGVEWEISQPVFVRLSVFFRFKVTLTL